MTETKDINLFDKKQADLTVMDAIKLNAGVLALCAIVPAAWVGCATVKDRVARRIVERKVRKELEKEIETEEK